MSPSAKYWLLFGTFIACALGASWWLERTPAPTVEQAVAHQITVQAETIYVERKGEAAQATVVVRTLRDTVLEHLTDTVLTKLFVRSVDTLIAKDSAERNAAGSVIASLHSELSLALRPHPEPRLRTTVAALYDPLTGQPSGSGEIAFRVFGGIQLTARAEQRPVLERPAVRIGVSVAF